MANRFATNLEPFQVLQSSLAGDYEIHSLDVGEMPLFLAFAAPVRETETGLKPRLPAGRGLTKQDAMTGAAAEAIELRSSLAHKLPAGLHKLSKQNGFDHLSALSLIDSNEITVPAQQVFLDYAACKGEKLLIDADSTGCAAGATLATAYKHALLECIERDAVATWWYGRKNPALLPVSLIDPLAPRVSWWISQRARTTLLFDLTSDVQVPCVSAVSADGNGLSVAIGSAAALSTAAAALSAILEMLQTEVTMELGRGSSDGRLVEWRKRASLKTMPQFEPGPASARIFAIEQQQLTEAVASSGHNAYGIELTLPDDPLPSARVIVPGFSALNRRINEERIAKACGLSTKDKYRFELLEPF